MLIRYLKIGQSLGIGDRYKRGTVTGITSIVDKNDLWVITVKMSQKVDRYYIVSTGRGSIKGDIKLS